jgi:bifunctional oligoribonuclease and PAP phosphatase NrnA
MPAAFAHLATPFAALLAAARGQPLVVIGHARPDGDCIGSQVALTRVLRALGVDAVCLNADPVPRRLAFLVGDTPFVTLEVAQTEQRVAIFTDCADRDRATKRLAEAFPAPLGNVDHHLSNPLFATHNLVETRAAAACEILADLVLAANLPVDATTATALYTGLATDTGQFRFGATTAATLHLAAELVARGAQPAAIGLELYEQETFGKLQLLQRFLASLRTCAGGRVCVGTIPAGTYEATNTSPEDTEGLVDYARSIAGVEIGVLIEERAGAIKASLRAKDPVYRVDQLAAHFGGGGHACAAGLNVRGETLENFTARLITVIEQRLR